MKFPGNYAKGKPHQPGVTVAAHFTGMHVSEDIGVPATETWYRGDDYAAVAAERDKCKAGLQSIVAIFEKPDGDYELLDFLDIAERALK